MLYVFPAFATLIGILAMVGGEIDDAPGLVLMGLLLAAGAIAHAALLNRRGQ